MHRIAIMAAALTLGCRGPVIQIPPNNAEAVREGRAATAAAIEALREGDAANYLAGIRMADRLRPNHPTLKYHLARASLLNGDTAGAIAALRELAGMGVATSIGDDEVLGPLANDPRVKPVVQALADNGIPLAVSDTAFVLEDPDFQPEGVARWGSEFLIASVHRRRIVRWSDGREFVLVDRGMWSGMGMAVHDGVLWVATTATAEGGAPESEIGDAAVLAVELPGGRIISRAALRGTDSMAHWFGDLVSTAEGTVYVSDSRAPAVYRLSGNSLVTVRQGDPFTSPQGIAAPPDGSLLFVADYSAGVFRVDPETGGTRLMRQPPNETLLGIDGLYYYRGDLIAIQNGMAPPRVLRLGVSGDGREITSIDILESNHPAYDDPTLGVIAGDTLYYVANSQWARFASEADPAGRQPPVVLALPLQ